MSDATHLKLERKIFIEGKVLVKTGLHIGGSSLGLTIGGVDNVVIRNPVSRLPYIPGSSLKGKMRSLLEKNHGLIKIVSEEKTIDSKTQTVWSGQLCTDPNQDLVQLFGYTPEDSKETSVTNPALTRLTVRDGDLHDPDNRLRNSEYTDMYCTEIKTEVNIDRLTAAATPRQFERVPAGAMFNLALVLDIYNVDTARDDENQSSRADRFIELLCEGLHLIEDDYLGGQGTRGYGGVEFYLHSVTEKTAEAYRTLQGANDCADYQEKFSCFIDRRLPEG